MDEYKRNNLVGDRMGVVGDSEGKNGEGCSGADAAAGSAEKENKDVIGNNTLNEEEEEEEEEDDIVRFTDRLICERLYDMYDKYCLSMTCYFFAEYRDRPRQLV